jgi:hypothetical protein
MRRALMVVAVAFLSTGCYHATIVTGLPASSDVMTKEWANGFIFGLVAPSTVETAARCKNGVAKVETQLSFLNMLASIVTLNLYTPMQIDVTCASSSRMSALNGKSEGVVVRANGDTPQARAAAVNEAAEAAVRTGKPSLVVF